MLGYYRNHKDYTTFVLTELGKLSETRPDQINEYKNAVMKMLTLDLDPMLSAIKSLYSPIGRPAEVQMEIFRSFVLMKHMRIKLDNWVDKLSQNPVLRTIAGFTPDNMPKTSSYYDFINRIVPLKELPEVKHVIKKPKEKLKKGEKMPPKNPGIVAKLVEQVITNEERFLKRLARRPERFLQRIFARVSVDASVKAGLIPKSVDVSGDGTCIETGASSYGKKVCKCREAGIYNCTCDRKFSDPNANWGWDSYKGHCFYGHTGYFISACNRDLRIDLPLYLRLVQGSRHDSVSAVVALSEFRELNPDLRINTFISDSASDNYATYNLLHHWDINAVIALNPTNKGNNKYPAPVGLDTNGVPVCPSGRKMLYAGYSKGRSRIKWRCPRAFTQGGLERYRPCPNCSESSYGRVVHTKPSWDIRLFTRIPRGSDEWKAKMRQRTAAERVNNRILHDYEIEGGDTRGKKRISFMVTLAAINVHLDAQVKSLTERRLLPGAQLFQASTA